jgi:hypothetical protein
MREVSIELDIAVIVCQKALFVTISLSCAFWLYQGLFIDHPMDRLCVLDCGSGSRRAYLASSHCNGRFRYGAILEGSRKSIDQK